MSEGKTPRRKVFVSYKYKDPSVYQLEGMDVGEDTDYQVTPRHYVDSMIEMLGKDNIYKGEQSDEDMGHLRDSTIYSKLKEKIFDSSVTVVLLSPNMRDYHKTQKNQWIPNEIYYSLLNKSRDGKRSKTNGMLAVALPSITNSYSYVMTQRSCGVRSWNTDSLFYILHKNMFNRKNRKGNQCSDCLNFHHNGLDHSYIRPILWREFEIDPNKYIEEVVQLRDQLDDFNILKDIGDS